MMATKINSRKLLTSLEFCEVDASLAADCRETLRGERQSLSAALHSGDGKAIEVASIEAIRVAKMWGVSIAY